MYSICRFTIGGGREEPAGICLLEDVSNRHRNMLRSRDDSGIHPSLAKRTVTTALTTAEYMRSACRAFSLSDCTCMVSKQIWRLLCSDLTCTQPGPEFPSVLERAMQPMPLYSAGYGGIWWLERYIHVLWSRKTLANHGG